MSQPLSGLRVVELCTGVAGSYAGKYLADYGADVVKVEPPGGDPTRHEGPFPTSGADPEQSALFLHLNTNKRSVVAAAGDVVVADLVAGADIVLQSAPVPEPAALRARHPHLVIVTLTSFGLTGPHAGMVGEEIVHYAYGGPMSATGSPDREPLKMGGSLGQYQCGSVAAGAALAAVRRAEAGGGGAHIDVSNIDTQVASIDRRMAYLLYAAYRGENVPRDGGYGASIIPVGCRPALDGHVQVATALNWIPRMITVLGAPELGARYAADPLSDETLADDVDAAVMAWTLGHERQAAMEEAQAEGWAVTALNRPLDVLTDRHFTDREFLHTVDHPVAGPVRQAGAPFRMEDGWRLRRPAPMLGADTDEVVAEARRPRGGTSADRQIDPAVAAQRPLDGIRVLDMTVVWAGPYATMQLADLGAEVIRLDNPWIFPAATRGVMPRPSRELVADIGGIFGGYPDAEPGPRPWNRVALFTGHGRNKRSATIDLRQPAGREAVLALAEQCDVMIENNSVGLVDRLGVGWDDVSARNPRLVMVRMPAVGLEGPYRDYLGFGVNFEALCGLGSLRGYRDTDLSENASVYHMDAASGAAAVVATLAALRRRDETGTGELVELSQSENMLNHIGEYLIDADRTGAVHEPLGNRHPTRAPQGCYPCDGDDAWVVVSVGDDSQWTGLRAALGDPPELADERFAHAEGRRSHHDEIDRHIAAATASRSADDVFTACQARGVPAAPVLHELEALEDPHLRARGLFRTNGNDELGEHPYPGHLFRWDGPDLAWGPIAVLGRDNEYVWREVVGLSAEEYGALDEGGHLSVDYLAPDGTSL